MKIISTPAVADWRYKVTCNNCESLLEAEASDLKKVGGQRDGDYAYCTCPVCKVMIWIARSQIPKGIWARLAYRASGSGHWHD